MSIIAAVPFFRKHKKCRHRFLAGGAGTMLQLYTFCWWCAAAGNRHRGGWPGGWRPRQPRPWSRMVTFWAARFTAGQCVQASRSARFPHGAGSSGRSCRPRHHKGCGGVMIFDLTFCPAASRSPQQPPQMGQVMYITGKCHSRPGQQNQYNNNICHGYTSTQICFANSVFRIHPTSWFCQAGTLGTTPALPATTKRRAAATVRRFCAIRLMFRRKGNGWKI